MCPTYTANTTANHGNTDCTLSLCNNINADVAAPINALIDTPTKTILEGGALLP